jgi:hypothetical protein
MRVAELYEPRRFRFIEAAPADRPAISLPKEVASDAAPAPFDFGEY